MLVFLKSQCEVLTVTSAEKVILRWGYLDAWILSNAARQHMTYNQLEPFKNNKFVHITLLKIKRKLQLQTCKQMKLYDLVKLQSMRDIRIQTIHSQCEFLINNTGLL